MRQLRGGTPSLKMHFEGPVRLPVSGEELASFYHLSGVDMEHKLCAGLSCFAARNLNKERWARALEQRPRVYCLGRCYASPSSSDDTTQPNIEIHCKTPIVLHGVAGEAATSLEGYGAIGGYEALEAAKKRPPEEVVKAVEASMLRGRGGAGFPAGKKWRAVFNASGSPKYVVANADEGDHGSYIDRFIMERCPHRLIEAMALAGYAIGAQYGYIYLRKEYPLCKVTLETALAEAREAGILGEHFDIGIVIGQGSYVCGEETSLLNSIEHRRPEVRARPPYPTDMGLFGKPTLVNNVETLASVPWIVAHGGEAYARMGFSTSRGTKAVCLNSLFERPGLYEVEFGMSLRSLFDGMGGGLRTGPVKAAIIGGPLAGVVHPRDLDTRFGFDEMHAIGAAVGHGGVVAFDQSTNMAELLAHIFFFGATESCGKCTPCRLGSRRVQEILQVAASGQKQSAEVKQELFDTLEAMKGTSLCGHGTGLAEVALSVIAKFGEEILKCFE